MNWGLRIVIVYGVFIAAIMTLVILSSNQRIDLVREDYYAAELKHQDRIDDISNASALLSPITVRRIENGILLSLPSEMRSKKITGNVLFYRPSDVRLDRKLELNPDSLGSQLLSVDLYPGIYQIQTQWNDGFKNYYSEISFNY